MPPRYSSKAIDAIFEASDDDSKGEIVIRAKEGESDTGVQSRRQGDLSMSPITGNVGERKREKARKPQKSSAGGAAGNRHASKPRPKSGSSRRAVVTASRDNQVRERQYHPPLSQDAESSSSSDDEDCSGDKMNNHQTILTSARGRLTSPSVVSSLTTATNNSGSSSGSNSTITQASISGAPLLKHIESVPESPLSPAVPDPPDVFAYLEKDDSPTDEEENEEEDEREQKCAGDTEWPSRPGYVPGSMPANSLPPGTGSMSSSISSSMHSDDGDGTSDRAADNDTDRSTSPERSVKGDDDSGKSHDPAPPGDTAAKIAAQMKAAQHRQNLHGGFQAFAAPRGVHRTTTGTGKPTHVQPLRGPPRPTSRPAPVPLSGYEALAAKLSTAPPRIADADSPCVRPIYRKFARLNHRLLLHLQDELCELEDSLRLLDSADTHSRTVAFPNVPSSASPSGTTGPPIQPASRRGHSVTSPELEWYRLDIMAKIAFKVSQYNQVLSSFNGVSRDLERPSVCDVDAYREFLGRENLIVENETKFLDAGREDFVVLGKQRQRRRPDSQPSLVGDDVGSVNSRSDAAPENTEGLRALESKPAEPARLSLHVPTLAMMVAAAVLVPILTFSVIPGFLGRMTVVLLVAAGMLGAALQGGLVESSELLGHDGHLIQCAGIYGAAMVIVAGIVS